jgi:multidrug efflux pump subunit AcrA (membrane-fusion protein)
LIMSAVTITAVRKVVLRIGLLGPAVLLSACQVIAPPSSPAPRLLDQQAVNVAGVAATPTAPTTQTSTFTIKRDTLSQSVALTGKVVPGRSALLTFRGTGTVSAVNVTSGQTVQQGDDLAEFTLDDDSLQAARAQATLADLAYQSEQAKLDDLQSGTNKDSIQQARVTIEKDQADIQKLEQDKAAIQGTNDRADQALAAAKTAADRHVTLAEVALQSAQDGLTAAQANVKQAQDDVQASQQKAAADRDQASADAATAAAAASAAVRAGQRQLDEANAKAEQANSQPATSSANQALETLQLKVDQDKEDVNYAQAAIKGAEGQDATVDHTASMIAAEIAAAHASARTAARALATDSLELKHQLANLGGAKGADAAQIKAATFGVEAAKEQVANLQLAEQAAQQKAQRLAKQAADKTVLTAPQAGQLSVQSAQTALKQAEAGVRTATVSLDDAKMAQAAATDATASPTQFADHALTAAQVQLSVDQARMQTLQGGNAGSEIAREKTRVNLLHDQSIAATAAAQPVIVLKAPFDASVADVSVSPGQTIEGGTSANSGASSGGGSPAIRLVTAGTNSIMADASESDVAQLDRGQKIDLSFPGLPGLSANGTIVDIASTGTVNKDNQVTYPVRIDVVSPPPSLKVGMTAQASLSVPLASGVLSAPRRAIRTVSGQTLLDKVGADGQVQAVPVRIGRTDGANVELLSGVQEGDVVAIYDGVTAGPKQP